MKIILLQRKGGGNVTIKEETEMQMLFEPLEGNAGDSCLISMEVEIGVESESRNNKRKIA